MTKLFSIRIFGVFALVVLMGCSAVPRGQRVSASAVQGQIVRPSVLAEGGRVLIEPFSAGTRAFASEELDQASLIVVRGIQDGLTQNAPRFQVVDDAGRDVSPDLRIIGRIQSMETMGEWKRYVGMKRQRFIEVDGKVVDEHNVLIAVFEHHLAMPYTAMDRTEFLLRVGKDIGEFLRSEH